MAAGKMQKNILKIGGADHHFTQIHLELDQRFQTLVNAWRLNFHHIIHLTTGKGQLITGKGQTFFRQNHCLSLAELLDQFLSFSTDNLSNPNFSGPQCRACLRQIHKIDARDTKDKQCNGGKNIDVCNIAVWADLIFHMRVKMDFCQRL